MPEYEYVYDSFDQDETVDIPEEAVGITVDSFSSMATVKYLLPTEEIDNE